MTRKRALRAIVVVTGFFASFAVAPEPVESAQPAESDLHRPFADVVHPFLTTYCVGCHGEEKQKGKLRLSTYSSVASVAEDLRLWEIVLERLEKKDMPPKEAKRRPSPEERQAVIDWIRRLRKHEAQRNAGDPGPVLARRLSNSEYDYTIRDLTGVDIRPTREFPIDPANEAGFDNSGESLAMSPALLKKYLAAARSVADHLVLKPTGIVFAPHDAVTDTDRDKYCVHRIVDFYKRQPTDYADYFLAAWRYRHREELGKPAASLTDLATEAAISPKYLKTVFAALTAPCDDDGPFAGLEALWQSLPAPTATKMPSGIRRQCVAMRDFVLHERERFGLQPEKGSGTVSGPVIDGLSAGSQPVTLMLNRHFATHRRRPAIAKGVSDDVKRFCSTFPDAFVVSERGRVYVKKKDQNKGRLLSAGFHLMVGYFRDDAPLYEMVLDESARQELDALWAELDFVTSAPSRQYRDFLFYERAEPPQMIESPEFDFARPERSDVTSEQTITRLAAVYLKKIHGMDVSAPLVKAIEYYFADMSKRIRWVEKARVAAEPYHLEALVEFAERAYRRPLSQTDRQSLLGFYRTLREVENLSHEDAIRDAVVSVLMAPQFCYRVDLPPDGGDDGPLSDYALASRLSYFLWSSMPDEELLAHAAVGDLARPTVLVDEAHRMLQDSRVRGLATEFGGNWLDFRRFDQFSSVDRDRFTTFTDELRQAMFEEPIHFVTDVVRRNGSVLDLLYADHTFANKVLAEHYGIPTPASTSEAEPNEWFRIEDSHRYGRGGLLPMSVFLTANSHPLCTSPVKRGYWVVRRVLGEHIPPPPPDVPELPKDEAKLGDLPLRDLLSEHRNNKSCAPCHDRFDSIGLVFEGYGPIGERRDKDLGGRPIESQATFPNGAEGGGLEGLKGYLRSHRQEEFVDNLCRKLLSYALGRSLLLSDEPTIESMRSRLRQDEERFGGLVETIVTSPQFLRKRGRDYGKERVIGHRRRRVANF